MTKQEQDKEKGIWIVYSSEANKKIQELLLKEKFKFKFMAKMEI